MATCEASNDVPCPSVLDNEPAEEDEVVVQMNMNESQLFQKGIDGLSVNDVYDIAASIGKEFEKLTDASGGAVFSDIMPKIIRVLELLESYASRSQNYSMDVVELHAMVQKLQMDGKSNDDKHREDLDMVDRAWRDEARQLFQTIETLQEDNKRLTQLLSENLDGTEDITTCGDQQTSVVSSMLGESMEKQRDEIREKNRQIEQQTMLGESMEKQRDEIREKNRQIEQQTEECEALSAQAQQLTKLNVNLRRKVALMEKQASSMANQSTDLESTCREKDRQIKDLQKRVSELRVQLKNNALKSTQEDGEHHVTSETLLQASLSDPLLANKLIIDLTDPDRPRFTMHELQEVLSERNSYKLKCILLDDELGYYKQFVKENVKEESWDEIDSGELLESPEQEINNNNNNNSLLTSNHNKPESAIKKLFASIFSRSAKSLAIPHEPQRPRLPSHLRYEMPMLDVSDVMPAIDITPSPEERDEAQLTTEMRIIQHVENSQNADDDDKTP